MEMWELLIYQRWMHIPEWRYAHQYFCVRLANNVGSKSFLKKKSKLNWTHPLIKLNTNKSCYVEKYLALVEMCMSLWNLSIFIQLRSISKSRFSKINTNSDITPPNNLDMVTFKKFLA
jgi:NurA-like 5'-3' nuclease